MPDWCSTSAICRPGLTVSPARNSGTTAPAHAALFMSLSFTATRPAKGARSFMLSMFRWALSIWSLALLRFSSSTANDARSVSARDFRSSWSCASRPFASSSVNTSFCCSIALLSRAPCTSSSPRRTSNRAVSSVTSSCARCTTASARILAISCSACASSDCAVSSRSTCSLRSNSTTTSPALTGVPVAAMWRICNGPPSDGATSVCAFKGLRSPVAYTTTGTSPSVTRAVGITLPSVCTLRIGAATIAVITSAVPSKPASDKPSCLRSGFFIASSFHRR